MFLKIILFNFLWFALWNPAIYAHEFLNQNLSDQQFLQTTEKIQKILTKFSKYGFVLPDPLTFTMTASVAWEEEVSSILIHLHDEEWLIERKITQATSPVFEDKNYRFELAGVSLDEFLQQKKRVENSVKSWRRAGASLKTPISFRFTSDINFHTIQQNVLWISISVENEESLEKILSLFFIFYFKLPEVSLQAQGISVNEFKQVRITVKELSRRWKKEEKGALPCFVAQHKQYPFFYRSDHFIFPWNAPIDVLEKNLETSLFPQKKQRTLSSIPLTKVIPQKEFSVLSTEKGVSLPKKQLETSLLLKKESVVPKLSTPILNGLMHELYHPEPSSQLHAIQAFASYGEQSAVMVPNLLGFLRSPFPEIRLASIQTMGAIGPSAVISVPVLLLSLEDSSSIIRENTALALGSILAPESLSFLQGQLKREKDESVQKALSSAIQQIQSASVSAKNF
ncbi:MAG: HEAT repeat domain-containing protein [Planctomycetota bacterium]